MSDNFQRKQIEKLKFGSETNFGQYFQNIPHDVRDSPPKASNAKNC